MTKSVFALLLAFMWTWSAFAQAPPTSVNPITGAKNVWSGDNFEQGCNIVGQGSPATFTPSCPVNFITITGAGQIIAVPSIGKPVGQPDNMVSKSVELRISYTGAFLPTFASGYGWINGTPPVQCNSSTGPTVDCLSAKVLPAGSADWIECRSIDSSHVGCGPPLTAMSAGGFQVVSGATATCASSGGAACTTGATNMTNATLIVGCIGYYNGGGASSTLSDSLGNSYTQVYSTVSGALTGRLFYTKPTSVTSSMTFNASDTGGNGDASPGLTVMGFSGSFTTPLDQSNNAPSSGNVTSLQSGSITPGQAGEVLASCLGVTTGETGGVGINSPFTLGPVQNSVGSNSYGSALGYQIQTSASAQNPTWSWTGSAPAVAGIASFK